MNNRLLKQYFSLKKMFIAFALLYHVAAFGCWDTDTTVPIEELVPSAESGDRDTQFRLAEEYFMGSHDCGRGEMAGPPQDLKKALFWYIKAADHGNSEAQFKLGVIYTNGEGVTANTEEAHRWFKRAAENGHPVAKQLIRKFGF